MPEQLLSSNSNLDTLRCLRQRVIKASLEEPLRGHPWPWRVVRSKSCPWGYDVQAKDGHVVESGLSHSIAREIRTHARQITEGKLLDIHLDAFDKAMKRRRKGGKRKSKA